MKKTITSLLMIFLFSTISNAQNSFEKLWLKVEKLEIDNLPKSALKVVEEIYTKAVKNNNSPQIVKSLFYKSKFSLTLEEDAQLKVIFEFKKHISESVFPTKNILENVLANLYWQYFTQNRYKFYNRTKTTSKVNIDDFRTWDLDTLFKEIHTYFNASLQEKEMLQGIDVTQFSDILQLQKTTKIYTPTLFDFLANNALSFYKSSETSITRPAYKFTIDNPNFLSDANTFSKLDITSKDSISLQLNALKTYQKLIELHTISGNKNALANIDVQRLNFVYQNAAFEDVNNIILNTFKASKKKFKDDESSGLYAFEIAQIFKNQSKNKEALAISSQIIKDFPKSLGAQKCFVLKSQIEAKTLSIQSEKYIPIDKNSRLIVTYKNVKKLFFTSYKINQKQQETLNKIYKFDDKKAFINKLEKSKIWQHNLRNEDDYLQHSTEVIVPKFTNGMYLIIASENEDLNENSIYGTTTIQITNLTLVQNTFNDQYNYQIVDRITGKPIKNAKIHLKNKVFKNSNYINKKLTTDKNGFASLKSDETYRNVNIEVDTKNDFATFGNHYLYEYNRTRYTDKKNEEIKIKPFIFTDRSIYRPGQTVYFKAIVIKKQGDKSEIFKNEFVEVTLYDVNDQVVKMLDLKLNDFGSVAGEFIIPNNGLTGNFTIDVDESSEKESKFYKNADFDIDYNNSVTISVEEYKRPKFETEFKPVTESFKISDSIKINGFAKAFSGANITDAKVVYRVRRKVQYPSWYYWRRPNTDSSSQEITNGESVTNEKGEFEITFKAIPDESVDKVSFPIFNYEITADVTDVNGETRSATTIVKVGYHSLIATISVANKIDKNQKENIISIDTKNLNDEFVAAKGTLKIYKLQAPKNSLRKRPWSAPDYQDISENTFRTLFPNDPYSNDESDEKNWKKGALIFTENFNTETSKEIILKNTKKWFSGKYIIILESNDKFGQAVKDEKRVTVFSSKEKEVADNKLFIINTDKTFYTTNDDVKLQIGSASNNISVVIQIEKNHKIVDTQIIKLKNDTKTISIPITEKDLGGFAIKYHFVNYNSFESGNLIIDVPYQPKNNINITTNIFRDKLQPGVKETWSFTIKDDKNDAIASEILASMYDASLDEFKSHNWNFNPITSRRVYNSYQTSNANNSFGNTNFNVKNIQRNYYGFPRIENNAYKWFGFRFARNRNIMLRGMSSLSNNLESKVSAISVMNDELDNVALEEVAFVIIKENKKEKEVEKVSLEGIQARKNFQETAFFFPQLKTAKNGKVSFSFTMPEALTRWKLQLLAHTKGLKSATKTLQTVTQKELMIVPNAPRFLREGDQIVFSAKISNLTNNQLNGFAQLQLTDAITGKEINADLENTNNTKNFKVDTNGNTNVSWKLSIPETVQAVQYKIVAKAGDFSDGEQNVLPVLTNRMLVTETLPMWIRSNQTKTFTLDKLKNNTSTTLKNHKLTLEMTSNPAWYAVQALPYLMEYPYECSEQTFSRYYANTLASFISNSNPRIQEVFNSWKSSDALLSNLEKNQELKSLIIQETPWLRDAQSETEQKKRIALLFDLNKMKNEQERAINKLQDMQMNSGGFPWFKGGNYPSAFITQHIAAGFGHLKKLGVSKFDKSTEKMIEKTIQFLDEEIVDQYQELLKKANRIKEEDGQKEYEDFLKRNHLKYFALQYLYTRSFYVNISLNDKTQKAIDYYRNQSATYWNDFNLYGKGQIALVQFRNGDKKVATKILKSLKENSITTDELGMYWKENIAGYYNYQAPVETQALLIETFSEIENDVKTIDNLKIWLLKNKQTNRWKTTKATTEAVYALLLNGTDFISITDMVDIKIGDEEINPVKLENVKIEAGTGYFKTSWNGNEIKTNMSEVTINKKGNGIAWGGLYWQYFEDLDKITSAETPLKLNKKLFLKVNADTGKELKEINNKTTLKVGDLITVRIELRSDRNMEFIHMKDMRASGVEPINVLSKYKWQDGLGYYESTKDAATNFFFDRLPKGVYVFEYDVRINNAGNFSNGVTTIQSMYAPEFISHSEGVRIKVNN